MTRDVAALGARTFDLLVIGGGIYGLTIAADAAQRGLSVALVERDDFGSGSTFNHLRTIHGGLRYLQSLDLRRARESIRERRTLARIAPRFVRPLPFVLPLTARLLRGPAMLWAGFRLDALVGRDRNLGVSPAHRLPPGRVISAATARDRFPWLRQRPMRAAAVWHDYAVTESDRLTFAWALAAHRHGASLANHTAAVELLRDRQRIVGARIVDSLTGQTSAIAARLVVNATGGDLDELLAPAGMPTRVPMLRAMNLVTTIAGGSAAIGAQTPAGRALFMVPWRGRALFGTWESSGVCASWERRPSDADVEAFVDQVAAAYPDCGLQRAQVTLVHRGLVPAVIDAGGRVALDGRQLVYDHATGVDPVHGLISVAGTKFTTARAVAEFVVDRALTKLGLPETPCRTASTPLPATSAAAVVVASQSPDAAWPSDVRTHLQAVFGDEEAGVRALADRQPHLAERLSDSEPVIGAQLAWAVRYELAATLADAVVRRTPLGALGCPSRRVLEHAAAIMATELAWTPARVASEIKAVEALYD